MKVLSIVLLCSCLSGCAGTTATVQNTPQLTDTARAQFNYEKVIDGLGIFQQASENATTVKDDNGNPLLSVNTARKIVLFTMTAIKTIQAQINGGWQAAVSYAYVTLKQSLTDAEKHNFASEIAALELVFAAVGVSF